MGNWVDVVIVLIFITVIVLETKRGFGRAVLDLLALFLAVKAAALLTDPLSASIKIATKPETNQAILYVSSFVIIGGILAFLGKLVYETTLFSAEIFDPLLGGICGIGISIILAHALMRALALSAGHDAIPRAIADSALGAELLRFDTYHRILNVLWKRPATPSGR